MLFAALCALAVLVGGALILMAVTAPATPSRRRHSESSAQMLDALTGRRLPGASRKRHQRKLVAAGILFVAIEATTGWLALALGSAIGVFLIPKLLSKPSKGASLELLSALEGWTRTLSSLLVAGKILPVTITASLGSTAPALYPAVRQLVGTINAPVHLTTERMLWALDRFADDIDDATGDMVVSVLKLAAMHEAQGLASRLSNLADKVAAEVQQRRAIEAAREEARGNAQILTLMFIAIVLYLPFGGGEAMAIYRTVPGQAFMVIALCGFFASLALLRRMSTIEPPPRFVPHAGGRTR